MDQPDREVEPQFSTPVRQIMLMLIVLGLTGFGAFVALPRVLPVFHYFPATLTSNRDFIIAQHC